ncbi:MAG TPA: UvrD-helicase domain-containing protein [Casimicrobiaceae bacterium]|nr:UvrD-helicase domain-containing protein [Casimicrobiaceae bacterium]
MNFPLNEPQRAAVRYLDGPLLVLAGAGSGKTRVITAKIAHLIERGFDPAQIAAITFTNKAAREMRERALRLLPKRDDAKVPIICTFHSLGLRILRTEAAALGLASRFSILDPGDIESIVAELLATTDRARARAAQWRISAWKNSLVTPSGALSAASNDADLAAARAYQRYDQTLRSYQAVDFDDLIAMPLAALERDAAAAERWRDRLSYLLIDEYQDTNPVQYRLLKLLAGTRAAFTAVGDDDQAIYGWRGATIENLEQLPRDFDSLKVIKLEQNYRSEVRILRSANALIANNAKLYDKKLWSERCLGDLIRVVPAADDEAEAEGVARRLLAQKFEQRGRFSDFAVLYRGNHQARAFERALSAQNVPYVISGGQSWFERAEVKDLVSYLRLIANDDDDPAFVRAVTTPRRGVGAQTLDKLGAAARANGGSLFAAIFVDALPVDLAPPQHGALVEFGALINGLRHRAEREPAGTLLSDLVSAIGYESYLFDTFDKAQAQVRSESVRDFVGWLSTKGEADEKNLLELTQMIALITMLEGQEGDAPDAVRLSTLHAAKGLEFPHVFMVGVEEGILPHRESVASCSVDEERRLMYVGMTRAQQSLQLSWCRRRKRAGEWHDAEPSRFIAELTQEDLRHADVPAGPEELAREKEAGNARLKSLRAMLMR